jgi:NADPH2:quinone reductase
MSFAQGAAIGVPSITAYRALFQRAHLQPGEIVLVHGASGGVGTITVQSARARGARVIGTAGTPDGLDLVRCMGAHSTVDHSKPNYLDQVLALTDGRGVDVIVEMLANVNLEKDFQALAKYGRIVIVGSRGSLEFTPRLAMMKEADVLGMAVWNTTQQEYVSALSAVAAALESGVLRPIVGRELPLEHAAQAHVDILKEKAQGKMVLAID